MLFIPTMHFGIHKCRFPCLFIQIHSLFFSCHFRLDVVEELKRSTSTNGFEEKNGIQGEDEITPSQRQNLDPVSEKWSNKEYKILKYAKNIPPNHPIRVARAVPNTAMNTHHYKYSSTHLNSNITPFDYVNQTSLHVIRLQVINGK